MTKIFNNLTNSAVEYIIDNFLAEFPHPERNQWEMLIIQHHEFSDEIRDFAILYSSMEGISEKDVNCELNIEVYESTISNAVDMILNTPSYVLGDVERRMADLKGTAVKALAVDMGLEKASVLMSQILSGTTKAPKQVLNKLAKKYETTVVDMSVHLQSRFGQNSVPAYKATNGKPKVVTSQRTWEESVKLLNLSQSDSEQLLRLDE